SLLTPPKKVNYADTQDLKKKIRVGKDGVIVKQNNYQATFLPQVWEELADFELFFTHLCQKAGLGPNCLSSHPEIYTYQVEKVKEA
ncbi:MAG: AMMECR1 domain-containing protein, partial [Anaerolineales bacterium]|nr:AMMECR1 domain-containing protein [Anaerolineales bacterium]